MNTTTTPEIFRSVLEKPDTTTKFNHYRTTMRPPKNIPYLVDNLWEWKRPKEYPCRRLAVFASPNKEIALKSGKAGGTVFRVEFQGLCKICQVKEYQDSKKHPECNTLKTFILKELCQKWIDAKLSEKEELGRLFIPCLTKNDMNFLFGSNEKLREIRDEVYNSIKYWDNVVTINKNKPLPDERGELFFEAKDGYYLRSI